MQPVHHLVTVVLLTLACACGPKPGKERGPCYGNGTCDLGLTCLSKVCVRPPAADCEKVGRKVGFLLLSNYEVPDKRSAFEKRMTARCRAEAMTESQGDCILRAADKSALSLCEKPLGVVSCETVFETVSNKFADDPQFAHLIAEMNRNRERALKKCRQQVITAAQFACIKQVKSVNELQECVE